MTVNMDHTMYYKVSNGEEASPQEILQKVYSALEEKGYDPINQIVGYLLSGDPAYITSYQDARNLIRKFERDDLLEEILKSYLGK